jgi:hypothetical protein
VLFNHRATIVDEVVDLAYEHWLYSAQQLWIPTFKDQANIAAPYSGFFLDHNMIASAIARIYQDKRGPAESRNLTFQVVWPYTYPRQHLEREVGDRRRRDGPGPARHHLAAPPR